MKNKIIKNKILLIVILLGAIGLAISVEENITLQTAKVTNNAAKNTQSSYNINVETPWQISNKLEYMRIRLRRTNRQGFSYYDALPMYDKDPSIKIYCIEPGARVSFRHYGYEYDDYRIITTKEDLINSGYTEYYMTPIYNSAGIFELPVAASYILSAEDKETTGEYVDIYCDGKINHVWLNEDDAKWLEKQRGIWRLCKNTASNGYRLDMIYPYGIGEKLILSDDISIFGGKASIYDSEAKNYTEYDLTVRNKGLQPKDNTNIDLVEAEFSNNLCTVGPFNISYTNGIYGKVAFAGISKVTLMGLDANKKEVQEIEIKNYYLKNNVGNYTKVSADSMYFFSGDNEYKIDRLNGNEQYIKSGQDFKLEFEYPSNSTIVYAKLKVEFKYMLANGEYNKLVGMEYYIWDGIFGETKNQTLIAADADRTIYTENLELEPVEIKLPYLGGNVWEDGLGSKENIADGKNNTTNDVPLPNIKVTLYTADGNLATLQADPNQSGISNEDIMHRVNPTYTDKDGNYLFEGIYPGKEYYVEFEYNGQIYLLTKKIIPEEEDTSKGLEKANERTDFNNKFAEIGAYPENYKTSNSLEKNLGTYNKVYSQYELMGYTLNEEGKYQKTGIQLIDGYLYEENGNQTITYEQGEISKKILDYIQKNKKSPDIKEIYSSIAGNDTEMWRKLQYIEDCKIKSYSDKYTATSEYKDYINQGLWRRQEERLILTKDVLYGATRINGKTEVYEYDDREDANWEIQTRMKNYAQYYSGAYVNGIYQSDLVYDGKNVGNTDNLLEVYITYKITIKNSSQNILTQITEVVDYYDEDYTFIDNLSWVMYGNKDELKLTRTNYYDMIDSLSLNKIPNAKDIISNTSSKYGENTQKNISDETKAIYIRGLEDKKLTAGEQAYIYLTFKVNKQDVTENDNIYANYAEINGYKTFYANGTELPNGNKITDDKTVAGIIDQKSIPGNLTAADLTGTKYEKNFENDTDRAKGINVKQNSGNRVINGTVWEDQRTKIFNNVAIGDGIRDENEKGVIGVTVLLLEVLDDGTEYLWQTTQTDLNGYYQFPPKGEENSNGIIPGNYIVRFIYGGNQQTLSTILREDGTLEKLSYNGQDFKSTVYQKDMTSGNDLEKEYYDISGLDSYGKNLSDAKDLWEDKKVTIKQENQLQNQNVTLQGRQTLINNSKTLTNALSELLALPYTNSNLSDEDVDNLRPYTEMVAETAIINIEGEYNRTESSLSDNNGIYVLKNVDFGLTERPKAQLELNKKVEHIKIKLANGNILFDTKQATNNLIWQGAKNYNLDTKIEENKYNYTYIDNILNILNRNGIIQITMDEELMHGATVEITYNIEVANVSETDYLDKEFYYKGEIPNNATVVTTTATQILDYVSNNLQYNALNNNGWDAINADSVIKNGLVNANLNNSVSQINTILQADETNKMLTELKPGEKTESQQLLLTQVITSQNSNDDLTYKNVAEIVQTENTVGRRMAFSIVGNQDPTQTAQEVDTSSAEPIIILPPFGEESLYLGLTLTVITMLASGIILIKKFVLC